MMKLAQQRIETFHAFVEQQGWKQTEALSPKYDRGCDFIVTDGETSVTVSFTFRGNLDLRGDNGKLKTALLEWIQQVQPKAIALRRERWSSHPYKTNPRGKAWKYDRGSWGLVEEVIYSRLGEEGPDPDEAIRQAGYEHRTPIKLGVPSSRFFAEVYTFQQGENALSPRYPYFVGVQMPTDYESIYVTDFPSLISLLGQLSSIVDKVQGVSE